MADEAPPTEQAPAEAAPPAPAPSKKKHVLTAAGVVSGLVVGMYVVGPVMSPRSGAAAASHASTAGAAGKDGSPKDPTDIRQPHLIENLVLNPAGSKGTRFLLVSVGVIGVDAVADDEIRRRDTEARDKVVNTLSAHTVEELVDISHRDEFRRAIVVALDSLLGKGRIKNVLFPQFVVQ